MPIKHDFVSMFCSKSPLPLNWVNSYYYFLGVEKYHNLIDISLYDRIRSLVSMNIDDLCNVKCTVVQTKQKHVLEFWIKIIMYTLYISCGSWVLWKKCQTIHKITLKMFPCKEDSNSKKIYIFCSLHIKLKTALHPFAYHINSAIQSNDIFYCPAIQQVLVVSQINTWTLPGTRCLNL